MPSYGTCRLRNILNGWKVEFTDLDLKLCFLSNIPTMGATSSGFPRDSFGKVLYLSRSDILNGV